MEKRSVLEDNRSHIAQGQTCKENLGCSVVTTLRERLDEVRRELLRLNPTDTPKVPQTIRKQFKKLNREKELLVDGILTHDPEYQMLIVTAELYPKRHPQATILGGQSREYRRRLLQ